LKNNLKKLIFKVPEPQHNIQDKHPQTVAIITCLFPEKQSVDTIIENRTTKHRYLFLKIF